MQFIRTLGRGSYGEVAQCEDLEEGGLVAVKRVLNVFNSEVGTEQCSAVQCSAQNTAQPWEVRVNRVTASAIAMVERSFSCIVSVLVPDSRMSFGIVLSNRTGGD